MTAPPQPTFARRTAEILGLAGAYYLAARLALLLAIPPGYATAVWPAAGLALGGTLLFGHRVWPGILIGSFLANAWTSLDTASAVSIPKAIALALSIGIGASLQAMAGAWLVRRFVGFPTTLVLEEKVLKFLALGGPVSCLINATVAVTSLCLAGAISWTGYAFHWFTWWVGDTIGALIFAPLVLIWLAPTRLIGLRRQLSVSVPLCLAFGMVVVVFIYTSALEQRRLRMDFERSTDRLVQTLTQNFDGSLEVLHFVESLFASAAEFDRRGTSESIRRLVARHPDLQVLTWNPRVLAAQREAFEQSARSNVNAGFQISERDAQRRLVRAASREEYFPALYHEPMEGNRSVMGFDLASNAGAVPAMNRARDTGLPAASGRTQVFREGSMHPAIVVIMPVYRSGSLPATVLQRRQDLRGFATAVIRISAVMDAAIQLARHAGIEIRLYDEAAPESRRVLYDSTAPETDSTNAPASMAPATTREAPQRIVAMEMAGRPWRLELMLETQSSSHPRSWLAWGVQAGGLLCTGLLGALLLVVTGRTARTEALVTERTAELHTTNEDLRHQIAERGRAEAELRKTQDGLEHRVLERTEELANTNAALQTEIQTHEQTEQALRHKQRELVEFIEHAAVGMRRVQSDGTILWANKFELEMLGYTREEYVGHHIGDFFQDPRTSQEIFLRLNRGEALRDFETQLRGKDGSIKHALINSNVLWKGGKCVDARFFTRDITARKLAQAALRESEARKVAIVESAPEGIITIEQNGRITEFNPAAEMIFGYRRDEVLGREMAGLIIPSAMRERHRRGLAHYLATGESAVLDKRVELNALRRDGTEFPAELTIIRIAGNGPPVFTGFVRDITERKRAEITASHLAAIVDSSADSIVGKSLEGIIISWNLGAERIYGYTSEEIKGRSIATLLPPDCGDEMPRIIERVRRGERIENYETERIRKDGRRIPVSLTISPIKDPAGRITGISTISRDITERKRIEKQLSASLKEKESMLKEIHHRVKNNLQVISSLLRMQAGVLQDPHAQELFLESQDRVKTMALIHERLCQSQNLAGIEFDHHLRELATMVFRSHSTRTGDIDLDVQAEPGFLAIESAVPVSLMVNEMVSNCLKHAFPDGRRGTVTIQFRRDEQQRFHLIVRDNGVGLPGDFASLSNSSLGLSLLSILTEQLGGELACRTGHGTEFEVTFGGLTPNGRN